MNILLIGGSGTVGSALADLLISKRNNVFLIDRNNTGKRILNVHHIVMDYHHTLPKTIQELVVNNKITIVVNFIVFNKEHAINDFHTFNGIIDHYFFISTTMVYDRRICSLTYTEKSKLGNPYSEYARNKIECEIKFNYYISKYGFPCTIIRPTDTYDERTLPFPIQGPYGFWQNILRMQNGKPHIIHDDGNNLWTLTNNYDFAYGLYGLLENKNTIGDTIQVTSDDVLSWNEIFEYVTRALNVQLIPHYISSPILAKYGSQYDLEDTLIGDASNTSIFDNSKLIQYCPEYKTTKYFEIEVTNTIQHILSNVKYHIEDLEFDKWCDYMIENY